MLFLNLIVYFNSIKVRLKPHIMIDQYNAVSFQFHKGTIKTDRDWYYNEAKNNFNSIKVRLKQVCSICQPSHLLFQFHKGTIKTWHSL